MDTQTDEECIQSAYVEGVTIIVLNNLRDFEDVFVPRASAFPHNSGYTQQVLWERYQ